MTSRRPRPKVPWWRRWWVLALVAVAGLDLLRVDVAGGRPVWALLDLALLGYVGLVAAWRLGVFGGGRQ